MKTMKIKGVGGTFELRVSVSSTTNEIIFDLIDGAGFVSCNNIPYNEAVKIRDALNDALKQATPNKHYWVATSHPAAPSGNNFLSPFSVGQHPTPKAAAQARVDQLMSGGSNSYGGLLVATKPFITSSSDPNVVGLFHYVKPLGSKGEVFEI